MLRLANRVGISTWDVSPPYSLPPSSRAHQRYWRHHDADGGGAAAGKRESKREKGCFAAIKTLTNFAERLQPALPADVAILITSAG